MSRLKLFTTAALTAGLLGGMAPAAFAGDVPTPVPSQQIGTVPAPCPVPVRTFTPTASPGHVQPADCPVAQPRLQRETFIVQLAQAGSTVLLNRVAATGPVSGTGSDAQLSNTLDRFRLPSLLRSVNVPHTGIAAPSVDLRLCTASVTQTGLWRFAGGTGLFRLARGNGIYQLVGQWWFPRLRNGVCSLTLLRGNPLLQNRIQPTYQTVSVVGTGTARI